MPMPPPRAAATGADVAQLEAEIARLEAEVGRLKSSSGDVPTAPVTAAAAGEESGGGTDVTAAVAPALTLDGRAALVTGGGTGIGRAVCLRLAQSGAHVLVADIDEQSAADTAAAIQEAGGTAGSARCDVTDAEDLREAVRAAAALSPGGLRILVNNAFGLPPGLDHRKDAVELEEHVWDKALDTASQKSAHSSHPACQLASMSMQYMRGRAQSYTGCMLCAVLWPAAFL